MLMECLFVSQNRRERISERLKILQELVPNGSKVDFQTSPEKLLSLQSYVGDLKLLYPRQNSL